VTSQLLAGLVISFHPNPVASGRKPHRIPSFRYFWKNRRMTTSDELSPTFRSSQLHTPHNLSRITIDDPHYRTYCKRLPLDRLGRHWSYGGIGSPRAWDSPVFKPIHGPPVAKHHDHVSSGLFPRSRGLPIEQFYDLTSLRRSNLRWNDELYAGLANYNDYIPYQVLVSRSQTLTLGSGRVRVWLRETNQVLAILT
jgi:hypothetical protein